MFKELTMFSSKYRTKIHYKIIMNQKKYRKVFGKIFQKS